jgi:hypothetical protein
MRGVRHEFVLRSVRSAYPSGCTTFVLARTPRSAGRSTSRVVIADTPMLARRAEFRVEDGERGRRRHPSGRGQRRGRRSGGAPASRRARHRCWHGDRHRRRRSLVHGPVVRRGGREFRGNPLRHRTEERAAAGGLRLARRGRLRPWADERGPRRSSSEQRGRVISRAQGWRTAATVSAVQPPLGRAAAHWRRVPRGRQGDLAGRRHGGGGVR